MSKAKRQAIPESAPEPITGRGRFTPTRFLSDCCDDTYWYLINEWKQGNQLRMDVLPVDASPAVLILARYAKDYGAELVDDYEALLDMYWNNVNEVRHPDKFFASCIVNLDDRGMSPDEESYESINIPTIYEELLP